jgi:hypothetical protein
VGDEIKHALLGWSGGGIPARYGAKDKAARLRHRLAEAVASAAYAGLDLSHLKCNRCSSTRRYSATGAYRPGVTAQQVLIDPALQRNR